MGVSDRRYPRGQRFIGRETFLEGDALVTLDLRSLIGRLDEHCRRALEAAAGLTMSRTHYNVEIEHWLVKLADGTDTDIAAIFRQYEIDHGRFMADLNKALDRLKTGNSRAPGLAPDVVDTAKQAWLLASIEQGLSRVRSGHVLLALLLSLIHI